MEKLLKSRLKFVAFLQLNFRILFISKWSIIYSDDYLQANRIKCYVEWPVLTDQQYH